MREVIIEKLTKFIADHPMTAEFEVVYFLVELRKLIDKERERSGLDKYPLVRFHADWAVHTRKDRITPAIGEIMTKIDNSIDTYPKNGDIGFLLLPEFRAELAVVLNKYSLPDEFCKKDDRWMEFMLTLTQVLADQPIIDPIPNISKFRYVDMKGEGIMATIDFKGDRAGFSTTIGFGK